MVNLAVSFCRHRSIPGAPQPPPHLITNKSADNTITRNLCAGIVLVVWPLSFVFVNTKKDLAKMEKVQTQGTFFLLNFMVPLLKSIVELLCTNGAPSTVIPSDRLEDIVHQTNSIISIISASLNMTANAKKLVLECLMPYLQVIVVGVGGVLAAASTAPEVELKLRSCASTNLTVILLRVITCLGCGVKGSLSPDFKTACLTHLNSAFNSMSNSGDNTRSLTKVEVKLLISLIKAMKVVYDDRSKEISAIIPSTIQMIQNQLLPLSSSNSNRPELLGSLCGLVENIMTAHFKAFVNKATKVDGNTASTNSVNGISVTPYSASTCISCVNKQVRNCIVEAVTVRLDDFSNR